MLYSLVQPKELLSNAVRAQIYRTVESNPGITVGGIAAIVQVKHQTVSYHLELLKETRYVIGLERGNKRLHFLIGAGYSAEDRELLSIGKNELAMQVIDVIEASPGINKKGVANALGITRTGGAWHVTKLVRAAVVEEVRRQGHCHLYVVPAKVDRLRALLRDAPAEAQPEPATVAP